MEASNFNLFPSTAQRPPLTSCFYTNSGILPEFTLKIFDKNCRIQGHNLVISLILERKIKKQKNLFLLNTIFYH
jgi:hypothetical protein